MLTTHNGYVTIKKNSSLNLIDFNYYFFIYNKILVALLNIKGVSYMNIIYFLVGILATTVGAISGLGGGLIIKPVLDVLGHYDISTIASLSSFTVFSMSVVSLIKSVKGKVKLDGTRTILLAIGSIIGGTIGNSLFNVFLERVNKDSLATDIQSIILFCLIAIILILYIYDDKIKALKNRKKQSVTDDEQECKDVTTTKTTIKDIIICSISGLILGITSSFLGIGGGPLNVIVLMYLLNMDAKNSSIHSIFIIFFSQGSKLLAIAFSTGFSDYNLSVLPFMAIGGISGGFLGGYLGGKMDKKNIKKLFVYCMILILMFNLYNIMR